MIASVKYHEYLWIVTISKDYVLLLVSDCIHNSHHQLNYSYFVAKTLLMYQVLLAPPTASRIKFPCLYRVVFYSFHLVFPYLRNTYLILRE